MISGRMHYGSFKKMIENDTASIRFDTLDKLSTLLDVQKRASPVEDSFVI